MTVRLLCDVTGYIFVIFGSFFNFHICLQTITNKKDGSDTTTETQSGTITIAVKTEQEKRAGDHYSSGFLEHFCFRRHLNQ